MPNRSDYRKDWNDSHIWRHEPPRYEPRPVRSVEPRTRTCFYCSVEFVPRLRQPLDLLGVMLCPPCYTQEMRREREERNVKQRNEPETVYDPSPRAAARKKPVRKTKAKAKKPVDKRPTAWDRILDPVLQA